MTSSGSQIIDGVLRLLAVDRTAFDVTSPAAANFIYGNHWRLSVQATTPVLIERRGHTWLLLKGDRRVWRALVVVLIMLLIPFLWGGSKHDPEEEYYR